MRWSDGCMAYLKHFFSEFSLSTIDKLVSIDRLVSKCLNRWVYDLDKHECYLSIIYQKDTTCINFICNSKVGDVIDK